MSWQQSKVRLGDVVTLQNGYAFKSSGFSTDNADIPLVKGSNLGHREVRWQEGPWWPSVDEDLFERFKLTTGDVVLAMDRPIVGGNLKYAWLSEWEPDALLVQRVCRLRGHKNLDQTYLRYVIGSPTFLGHIEQITTGVNVPHISGGDIQKFEFHLPPLPIQTRIADILSAYDDLIENNNRRMALLEEAIHLLYREWFVYLRFPGHEQVKVVDGVPEGWERTTLGEITTLISRGVSPKYDEESVDRAVNQRCIRGRRINLSLARKHKAKVSDAKRLRQWDVLVNSTGVGTLGRVAQVSFVPERLTVDTHVTIIRPNEEQNPIWFGAAMESLESQFERMGHGATGQTELRRTLLAELSILAPTKELQKRFARTIEEMRQMCLSLSGQNERLREARDLLLPRLMNGSIAV